MARYRENLPQLGNDIFACYTGMDTDIIYNGEIDLPGFASYPLLLTVEGKNILRVVLLSIPRNLVELARELSVAVILDSVKWGTNRDRGAELGYSPDDFKQFNIEAIGLIASVREENGDLPTVLCGQIGPRGDGYEPSC